MDRIINLKERRINVVLKYNTKKELDKLSFSRRDSYDDIIRRLIIEHYQHSTNNHNGGMNKISFSSKLKRKTSSLELDGLKIDYSFNLPSKNGLENYTFDIRYKILSSNKLTPLKNILIYVKLIEKIIQTYIDPLFKLEKIHFANNKEAYKNILDLSWWERNFKNSGLSYETYKKDIKEKFIELGAV